MNLNCYLVDKYMVEVWVPLGNLNKKEKHPEGTHVTVTMRLITIHRVTYQVVMQLWFTWLTLRVIITPYNSKYGLIVMDRGGHWGNSFWSYYKSFDKSSGDYGTLGSLIEWPMNSPQRSIYFMSLRMTRSLWKWVIVWLVRCPATVHVCFIFLLFLSFLRISQKVCLNK